MYYHAINENTMQYNTNYLPETVFEELLRHVVITVGVFKGQVEFVVCVQSVVAVALRRPRTVDGATGAEYVDWNVFLQLLCELPPSVLRVTVRHEPRNHLRLISRVVSHRRRFDLPVTPSTSSDHLRRERHKLGVRSDDRRVPSIGGRPVDDVVRPGEVDGVGRRLQDPEGPDLPAGLPFGP